MRLCVAGEIGTNILEEQQNLANNEGSGLPEMVAATHRTTQHHPQSTFYHHENLKPAARISNHFTKKVTTILLDDDAITLSCKWQSTNDKVSFKNITSSNTKTQLTMGLDSSNITLISNRCLRMGSSCSCTISDNICTFLKIVNQKLGIPLTSSFLLILNNKPYGSDN
jgi:hypothetical protein